MADQLSEAGVDDPPWALFGASTPQAWEFTRSWLVGYRKQAGLTQAQVAERMGVSQPVVSAFERGASDPHISTIARYVRALGLSARFEAGPIEACLEEDR